MKGTTNLKVKFHEAWTGSSILLIVREDDGSRVAQVSNPKTPADEQDWAYARRIVACVNALRPFTTEQILADAIGMEEIKQQRNEALAMLRRLADADKAASEAKTKDTAVQTAIDFDAALLAARGLLASMERE